MYKLLIFLFWLPCLAFAQNSVSYYSNTLKDNNGRPLAGATIVNTNTRQVTAANSQGFFTIKANIGDLLTISAVGYTTSQVRVTAKLLQPVAKNSQQAVIPILSDDYNALIKSSSQNNNFYQTDSTTAINLSKIRLKPGSYLYENIAHLEIQKNRLLITPYATKRISFGGSYSSTVELKRTNKLPELQNEYAQGRPLNGKLTWQGAETGEPFSFGPSISSLYYDGSNYAYDVNGKLVNSGTGKLAKAYNNSIFHTGILQSQMFYLHSSLYNGVNYLPLVHFTFNASQTGQSNVIQQNRNTTNKIGACLFINPQQFSITSSYNYQQDGFSNSNRNGFLNRVYQSAIVTPVSFSNKQGYIFPTGQRSYSISIDNPYFLLANNGNNYNRSQNNAALSVERKGSKVSYKLSESYEAVLQQSNEGYKSYTTAFENGITTQRNQLDKVYATQANVAYVSRRDAFTHTGSVNYIFAATQTNISYSNPLNSCSYQRSSHDAVFNWSSNYISYPFDAGIAVANKFYISNTANRKSFLLPSFSGYFRFNNVVSNVDIKLAANWNSYNSELPIQQSLAYSNLLQYSTKQSLQYFLKQEVVSYKNLAPIKHNEWNGRIELNYKYKASFTAELFVRNVQGDIFPLYSSGTMNLHNVASHQNRGMELQLNINGNQGYYKKLKWSGNLSLLTYNSKVTQVENDYNYLPIAGFSNIHKTLVEGQPLGVIVGSAWLTDNSGNKIIDADGFPIASSQRQIIGNPIPDFVLKANSLLTWKKWKLQADLEWREGGDIWNGTEAVLNYYGRSANTAQSRNTTNYIFTGVMQNGQKNNLPVSFLDPLKPVQLNRWTRYGYSGVDEEHIEKGDYLRIHSVMLSYKCPFRKIIQSITVSGYANNILLWSAYKGVDPSQLLYDSPGSDGLDYFNLPSVKSFGINATLQF